MQYFFYLENESFNLNYSRGGEASNVIPPTLDASEQSLNLSIVESPGRAVDSSSPPWSKSSIIENQKSSAPSNNDGVSACKDCKYNNGDILHTEDTVDNLKKSNGISIHNSDVPKPFSSCPVKMEDGVMKLPPLTIPLNSISQTPTVRMRSKSMIRYSPSAASPSQLLSSPDSSVFIETSPKLNRTFKSPLRTFSTAGSSSNLHVTATPNFPLTPVSNRRYSMKSPSISSGMDSYYNGSPKSLYNFSEHYDRNKQDTVSVKSAPVISRLKINNTSSKEQKKSKGKTEYYS